MTFDQYIGMQFDDAGGELAHWIHIETLANQQGGRQEQGVRISSRAHFQSALDSSGAWGT